MKNSNVISKAFRPSIEPTYDDATTQEEALSPAMLLTQKLPLLHDHVRGPFREVKLREGRAKGEEITTQDELIEELTRQLTNQEQRAAAPNVDEIRKVVYRKNVEILAQALLEARSELDMTQQATQTQPQRTGVFRIFNLFSVFSNNTEQHQATATSASGQNRTQ